MFSTTDTIVAIATPPGRGGIGVVRLSGPGSRAITRTIVTHDGPLEPRHATLTLVRADANAIDQVVATYFPAPHSYTGEDVVELSAHGSPIVLRAMVAAALNAGARLAEPGEFTLRAFLGGRIDLIQAEAVADLVDAVTPLQARAAFDQLQGTLTQAICEIDTRLFDLIARLEASVDFPDEGYHFIERGTLVDAIDGLIASTSTLLAGAHRGRLVREGLAIAIVGKPNVGKSSLFNALVGASRAIVTDVPGTTRDLVTEVVDVDGIRVTLVDTAGLRPTMEIVEAEGVRRARQAQDVADLILIVLDASQPIDRLDREIISRAPDSRRLIVANKIDLPCVGRSVHAEWDCTVSARTGDGLGDLRQAIARALDVEPSSEPPPVTNIRHIDLIRRAAAALKRARDAIVETAGLSEEFILADLQEARGAVEEVSGRRAPDEMLAHIFSRFCVGK
jgi:tRNA modification GTPase